jgi:23S rRNA pseudouridine1911/1915/1917 synthase
VNALLFHCGELGSSFPSEGIRPGIVHRLDKDTSGVMIAAKNPRAHEFRAAQFAARRTRKLYIALVSGAPSLEKGRVETRITRDPASRRKFVSADSGGKTALTFYTVLRVFPAPQNQSQRGPSRYALVSLRPRTGRTHQLRVHMRHISSPIVGDPLYGVRDPLFPGQTLMLHAHRLGILLPGETAPREFLAPLPIRFIEAIRRLQSFSSR